MQNTTLRIEKGEIYTVTIPVDTATSKSSANIWVQHPAAQDTFLSAIDSGDVQTLGPYLDVANFRIEVEGSITIARVGAGSTPVSLFAQIPALTPCAFVEDATDEVDVVTQLNELMANMRAVGLMAADE